MKSIAEEEIQSIESINKLSQIRNKNRKKNLIPLSISLSGDISDEGGGFCLSVSSADKVTAEEVFSRWYSIIKREGQSTKREKVGGYQ